MNKQTFHMSIDIQTRAKYMFGLGSARLELCQTLPPPWRSPVPGCLQRLGNKLHGCIRKSWPGIRGFRDLYVHLRTTALISKEAEEMHKKGSERLQRILGLDTFSSMNNLANVLQEQGRNSIGRQAAGPDQTMSMPAAA